MFFSCGTSTVDAKVTLKEENNLPRREIFRKVVKNDKDVVASENGKNSLLLSITFIKAAIVIRP